MGKGAGMGKYYIRKDGTYKGVDSIDRRRKLVDDEKNGNFTPKDAGTSRKFKGTQLIEFTFKMPNGGTRTTQAYTSEQARREVGAPKNAKIVKQEIVSEERRKKR